MQVLSFLYSRRNYTLFSGGDSMFKRLMDLISRIIARDEFELTHQKVIRILANRIDQDLKARR